MRCSTCLLPLNEQLRPPALRAAVEPVLLNETELHEPRSARGHEGSPAWHTA